MLVSLFIPFLDNLTLVIKLLRVKINKYCQDALLVTPTLSKSLEACSLVDIESFSFWPLPPIKYLIHGS
jgi:hypothetical protein